MYPILANSREIIKTGMISADYRGVYSFKLTRNGTVASEISRQQCSLCASNNDIGTEHLNTTALPNGHVSKILQGGI